MRNVGGILFSRVVEHVVNSTVSETFVGRVCKNPSHCPSCVPEAHRVHKRIREHDGMFFKHNPEPVVAQVVRDSRANGCTERLPCMDQLPSDIVVLQFWSRNGWAYRRPAAFRTYSSCFPFVLRLVVRKVLSVNRHVLSDIACSALQAPAENFQN